MCVPLRSHGVSPVTLANRHEVWPILPVAGDGEAFHRYDAAMLRGTDTQSYSAWPPRSSWGLACLRSTALSGSSFGCLESTFPSWAGSIRWVTTEDLPDDYRTVIMNRNLEDLSHEEVAERMNRTPGAVRMLWLRALAELRAKIDH